MKFTFIKHVKQTDILAKNIYNDDGTILLREGTKLSNYYINKLKTNGVFCIYVKDDDLFDIVEDTVFAELKETTINKLPNIFKDMILCDEKSFKESISVVEDLVDYIIDSGSIGNNLYDVKNYDDYTYSHCVDTCIMSSFLGLSLNLSNKELKELGTAAILHDIGKIKISNDIINKKGPLTDEEFIEIKKHPIYAVEVLSSSSLISPGVKSAILQHHERIDGKGYPFGIKDESICKYAKIISVSDVYTALTTNRSYRKRFTPSDAYEFILSGADTTFDFEVVKSFVDTFAIYPLGCRVRLSNGIEGYVVKQNVSLPARPIIRVIYDKDSKERIPPYEIDLISYLNVVVESII